MVGVKVRQPLTEGVQDVVPTVPNGVSVSYDLAVGEGPNPAAEAEAFATYESIYGPHGGRPGRGAHSGDPRLRGGTGDTVAGHHRSPPVRTLHGLMGH